MKSGLAESLLATIMGWSQEEVSKEIPFLIAMANFKYNEYQQFSPGIRFIESLAQWLRQFETKEEKASAYEFVKHRLIFLSNNQISHLTNLSYSTIIEPIIIKKVASQIEIPDYLIAQTIASEQYKKTFRQSLFIGLSDGSKIDQLRRYAQLNNEQVLTTYYIDQDKISDLQAELKSSCNADKFSSIFLIDDFTASGKSYARIEDGKEKGKILKLLNKIYNTEDPVSSIIDKESLTIHIVFYVATEGAMNNMTNAINQYAKSKGVNISYTIQAVQIINDDIKSVFIEDSVFLSLLQKYYDDDINDKHYKKGNINNWPYLGFGECGLSLVLHHNTPNNSLPILWFPEDMKVRGLFPRITRHKE